MTFEYSMTVADPGIFQRGGGILLIFWVFKGGFVPLSQCTIYTLFWQNVSTNEVQTPRSPLLDPPMYDAWIFRHNYFLRGHIILLFQPIEERDYQISINSRQDWLVHRQQMSRVLYQTFWRLLPKHTDWQSYRKCNERGNYCVFIYVYNKASLLKEEEKRKRQWHERVGRSIIKFCTRSPYLFYCKF
jgi:hypothetical protein